MGVVFLFCFVRCFGDDRYVGEGLDPLKVIWLLGGNIIEVGMGEVGARLRLGLRVVEGWVG